MTSSLSRSRLGWLAGLALLGLAPSSQAATQCDTDPKAVPFEATVDPTALNKLLARLGRIDIPSLPSANLTLSGLCVDHQVPISLGLVSLPVSQAPFTVTPSPGRIQVDLEIPGPFEVGLDGGNYRAVNCDSSCVIVIPYIGEIFNGCSIEAGIVGPVVGLFQASVSWDDVRVSQVADTCVLGDCTAVHPLESSQASLPGFDIDATGFGSCQVCLDFPDPIPDPPCFNPCSGIDPLLEALIRPLLEDLISAAFVNQGQGILIAVFSRQIVKDFGCIDIPEVRECKKALGSALAGLVRSPRDHGVNAVFYSLPLVLAVGLAMRLRRRRPTRTRTD